MLSPLHHLTSASLILSLLFATPVLAQTTSPAAQPASRHANIRQAILAEPGVRTSEVSTEELQQILAQGSALLLDTRPHLEWALGHIPGALNVAPKPGMSMSLYTSDVAEVERLTRGEKSRPIILYCNGPFCGKSKRVAEDLLAAGFTQVRRYQLGAPVWRALGGVMEIEPDGIRYVRAGDQTAVFVDARAPEQFRAGSVPGARNIPLADVAAAKDDGRLPMEDHNTRIIVFGGSPEEARAVAQEIARNAFHNVSYFPGTFSQLQAVLRHLPQRHAQ